MDLYHRPATKFVAEFIGSPAMNVFAPDLVPDLRGLVVSDGTGFIGCRPEHLAILPEGAGHFDATILVREQLGGETLLYAQVSDGLTVVLRTHGDDVTMPGTRIGIEIPPHRLHRFGADGRALT